ncbi:MAG: YjgP/YjgQ family permease [Sphingobacteriales bacterium]|nr:MAG: YjgP/YjgQ family permease [Sphingobacteriales bacterium]
MKKIFTLTTFSFIGPFAATFFVVLFTLLIQFLWKYIDDLVGKGLEWYVLLELLFYASASFVPLALPLSILLSSIMCFGKLAETYELVALKSAGVSLLRIMFPLITVVFMLSGFAFYFSNNIIPRANLKFHSLLWDVRQQRPALDIQEGYFYGGIDNYSIRIQKKDKKSAKIEGIIIYDHTRNRGNDVVMTANSGEMYTTEDKRWLILKLFNGTRFEEMEVRSAGPPTYPSNRLNFKSYEIKFDLSTFNLSRTKEELFKDNYQMLNIGQLQYYTDSVSSIVAKKRAEVVDYSRPYFQFYHDTAYYYNTYVSFNKLAGNEAFFASIPKQDRGTTVVRALNTARTLKGVMRGQAEDIAAYDKMNRRYQMEWHRKFALSLACLTLFFIGAPLGAIIRKGGLGMPTVVSIGMFMIFYMISIFGERSAKDGAISPFVGMWLPTFILMPIGFWLTWRANIDKISFNFDRTRRFFDWVGNLFRKKNKRLDADSAAV